VGSAASTALGIGVGNAQASASNGNIGNIAQVREAISQTYIGIYGGIWRACIRQLGMLAMVRGKSHISVACLVGDTFSQTQNARALAHSARGAAHSNQARHTRDLAWRVALLRDGTQYYNALSCLRQTCLCCGLAKCLSAAPSRSIRAGDMHLPRLKRTLK